MDTLTQQELLERTPPGKTSLVSDFSIEGRDLTRARTPEITLHCETCNGDRFFSVLNTGNILDKDVHNDIFLVYLCRNCQQSYKTFAINAIYDEETESWKVFKYGEYPSFGPPTPSRTITLIGPERDQFLKGRRCENQGLGVGAFVYYRRVVESQKNRIFDEIIRVSRHLNADEALLVELEQAKMETQFTKAVQAIKHGLPQSLLVNGHNPLLLLHQALSAGVHDLSDTQCLEFASSIRVVLIEFAERMAQAMKDEAELTNAIQRLAQRG